MKKLNWHSIAGRDSSWRREWLAGCTMFSAMLYIVLLNPVLLAQSGMDFSGAYMATVLSAAVASFLMGWLADYPIAAAPGIGLNAYFVYSVVLSQGYSWQEAMGSVFLASVLFLVLAATPFFHAFLEAVPQSLKMAIMGGVGILAALLGLIRGKLIVGSPASVTMLGDLSEPTAFLTLLGLLVTAVLLANRVQSALLAGMGVVLAAGLLLGFVVLPPEMFSWPQGLDRTAGQLAFSFRGGMPLILLVMFLLLVFHTTGILLGVGSQTKMPEGTSADMQKRFRAAALGSLLGSLLGGGLVTGSVESAAGTGSGGRTGMAAILTAGLFLLLLFCTPLAKAIAGMAAITAPALIFTGFFMASGIRDIDWQDISEGVPAFLTMAVMPLSYDILAGIGTGVVSYVLLKLFSGKGREVKPLLYILAVLFAFQLGSSTW